MQRLEWFSREETSSGCKGWSGLVRRKQVQDATSKFEWFNSGKQVKDAKVGVG